LKVPSTQKSAVRKDRTPQPRRVPRTAAFLAAIVESTDDAVIGKTLGGVITSWNDGARRAYGYTALEAVGRPIAMLVPDDRRAELKRIMSSVRAGRSVAHLDTVRRRKDGTLIEVSLSVSPIRDHAGKTVGASTIARDVTERNRAERRFRLVVDATPNALVMADAAGRIVLVNAQAEKLFGYTREELLRLSVDDLVPHAARGAHHGHRAAFDADPRARAMGVGRDLHALRKDGTEFPVEIGLNPLVESYGRFVLASIIDITHRRELEKKLAHGETLATIGMMAASMGHEIRNPLSSIVLAAQALARGDLDASDRGSVMTILTEESRRLQRTLEDFLQYSRPRTPKKAPGDLDAAVGEVLTAATSDPALVGKTRVVRRLAAGKTPARFDSDQLRQVLWNVIRNGLQALGGKGTLTVATEATERRVVVRVQDDGPGIPAADRETIFTPFFTTKSQGTGLGLAISRNIVMAHGGELRLETPDGGGCAFVVDLPR
jgi:PAS domain S-box-containing protein